MWQGRVVDLLSLEQAVPLLVLLGDLIAGREFVAHATEFCSQLDVPWIAASKARKHLLQAFVSGVPGDC